MSIVTKIYSSNEWNSLEEHFKAQETSYITYLDSEWEYNRIKISYSDEWYLAILSDWTRYLESTKEKMFIFLSSYLQEKFKSSTQLRDQTKPIRRFHEEISENNEEDDEELSPRERVFRERRKRREQYLSQVTQEEEENFRDSDERENRWMRDSENFNPKKRISPEIYAKAKRLDEKIDQKLKELNDPKKIYWVYWWVWLVWTLGFLSWSSIWLVWWYLLSLGLLVYSSKKISRERLKLRIRKERLRRILDN